ncbi:MAG: hypothetical protein Q6K80_07400 [Thermostichus sp. DG_1_6_bins_120]
MRRQLKILNQILDYKLADVRLFGRAELKGPNLNILLERLPGDVVDTVQVMEIVRTAVEASMLQDLRKVNVYLWCRGQEADAPEWSGSFALEPLLLTNSAEPLSRASSYRQDYPGMRVLFFCLGICLSGFYVLGGWHRVDLIPPAVALLLGIGFPWLKRWLERWRPPLFRHVLLGTGLVLLGILVALIWQRGWSVVYGILSLVAILLLGLGA